MKSIINVVTTVSSWPEALVSQRLLLEKFSKQEFKFVAVIDTSPHANPWNLWDSNLRDRAIEIAKENCDEVLIFPEKLHQNRRILFPNTNRKKAKFSNERAADALQFAANEIIFKEKKPTIIIDSDMFPIREFNVLKNLDKNAIRGVWQFRTGRFGQELSYYWNGILELNPERMDFHDEFSFDCGKIHGARVDTGGHTYKWVKSMKQSGKEDLLGQITHFSSLNWKLQDYPYIITEHINNFIENDDRNLNGRIFTEIYDNNFLHFRAGSNWKAENPIQVSARHSKFLEALNKSI